MKHSRIFNDAQRWTRLTVIAGAMSLAATASMAAPVTVTFSEAGAPALFSQLDGTTFYQAYGIADFGSSVIFGADPRLPDDGYGIYNYPTALGSVSFSSGVSGLSLTWATAGGGISFYADVFDSRHTLLESFFFDGSGAPGNSSGVASFLASDIWSLEYHDGGQQVAIDTLSFNTSVPEPITIGLFGAGLAGAAALRRRRKV